MAVNPGQYPFQGWVTWGLEPTVEEQERVPGPGFVGARGNEEDAKAMCEEYAREHPNRLVTLYDYSEPDRVVDQWLYTIEEGE